MYKISKEKDIEGIVNDIITVDISGRELIGTLSEAAFEKQKFNPPMKAAELLADNVAQGDTVLILTGFPIPPAMVQENDGPLGAASIARAVEGLQANPVILTEELYKDVSKAAVKTIGLAVVDLERNLESDLTVSVEDFPIDDTEAKKRTKELIEELDPSAIVSIEKTGINSVGEFHNSSGTNITDYVSKVNHLFDFVGDSVKTIAVGDGGNEIGMGKIRETVRKEVPFGKECGCGCGGGTADTIIPDVLVPATVSNWGGYAITTCLSQLAGLPLMHTPEVERQMLIQASIAGIDGPNRRGWCDGLAIEVHESIIQLLLEALSSRSARFKKRLKEGLP